jgi:hypothetical protein
VRSERAHIHLTLFFIPQKSIHSSLPFHPFIEVPRSLHHTIHSTAISYSILYSTVSGSTTLPYNNQFVRTPSTTAQKEHLAPGSQTSMLLSISNQKKNKRKEDTIRSCTVLLCTGSTLRHLFFFFSSPFSSPSSDSRPTSVLDLCLFTLLYPS